MSVPQYSLILKNDGTVWGCGENRYWQLGDGTSNNSSTLVQMVNGDDVKQIACGIDFSLILKNDGTVWSCGGNRFGQLGNGTTNDSLSFVQMANATDVRQIACGYTHTLILKNDGTAWGCGQNSYGQLGDGTINDALSLIQIPNATNVKQLAGGFFHSLVLKNDGTVWGCGHNSYGQLGDGTTTTDRKTLVQMLNATNVKQITCGDYHSLVLKYDGTVWGCGENGCGQLGDGTDTSSSTLVQMINGDNVRTLMNVVNDLFFLINANNKYYTTDGTTLTEVTTLDLETIKSEGFTNITLVNDYLEANPTPEFTSYKIISSVVTSLHTRYYKPSYMMILNKPFNKQNVCTIQNNFISHNSDKFDVFYTFSLDNGVTWKTVDNTNNIIDFPTFTMTTDNTTTEWETLKELVLENGISYSNTSFDVVLDDLLDELNFRIIIVLKMKDYIKESEANTQGVSKVELKTSTV